MLNNLGKAKTIKFIRNLNLVLDYSLSDINQDAYTYIRVTLKELLK